MGQETELREPGGNRVTLPLGVVLRPPVSLDDLKADTELDPEGAEEFAILIRALRNEGPRPVSL